jgi:hypothetical protein
LVISKLDYWVGANKSVSLRLVQELKTKCRNKAVGNEALLLKVVASNRLIEIHKLPLFSKCLFKGIMIAFNQRIAHH